MHFEFYFLMHIFFFAEMLWLSKVLEGPAGSTDDTPSDSAPLNEAVDAGAPHNSPPLEIEEMNLPPLKKVKTRKGKAPIS